MRSLRVSSKILSVGSSIRRPYGNISSLTPLVTPFSSSSSSSRCFCQGSQKINNSPSSNSIQYTTSSSSSSSSSSQQQQQQHDTSANPSNNSNATINTTSDQSEEIPEPPEQGRTLRRDAIIFGVVMLVLGYVWTKYSEKSSRYDKETLNEVNTMRAHMHHALETADGDARQYHLKQAEIHCRKALQDVGGGYLSYDSQGHVVNIAENRQNLLTYDAAIVTLHLQLAKICYLQKNYQVAIDNYLVVLKALTQHFGKDSTELLLPCQQISECYMNLKQFAMSKMFLEMALSIISPSHVQYSPLCEQFAALLRKQGEWKASIEYSNKAIEAAKTLLGEEHIQLARLYLGRACSEMELKENTKAEKTARTALQIVEFNGDLLSKDSSGHTSFEWKELKCSVLYVLGQSLIEERRLSDAKLIFQNALSLASQLNDQSKQLLIADQLRDIELLQQQQQQQQQTSGLKKD